MFVDLFDSRELDFDIFYNKGKRNYNFFTNTCLNTGITFLIEEQKDIFNENDFEVTCPCCDQVMGQASSKTNPKVIAWFQKSQNSKILKLVYTPFASETIKDDLPKLFQKQVVFNMFSKMEVYRAPLNSIKELKKWPIKISLSKKLFIKSIQLINQEQLNLKLEKQIKLEEKAKSIAKKKSPKLKRLSAYLNKISKDSNNEELNSNQATKSLDLIEMASKKEEELQRRLLRNYLKKGKLIKFLQYNPSTPQQKDLQHLLTISGIIE